MAKYDSYVICTSPRSGSTLLCRMLMASGVAGAPDSHFHRPSVSSWLETFKVSPPANATDEQTLHAIFETVIKHGRGSTDIFGLRMQRHSFDFFMQKLEVLHPKEGNDVARFEATFGKTLFIYLKRHDKVEQAISYVKAQQTGLWHQAPDGTELERLSPPKEPAYDSTRIQDCFDTMVGYDQGWELWFKAESINPLRISYEELSANPMNTLRVTLDRLGVASNAADGIAPDIRKLADETSKAWAERFRSGLNISQ